MKNKLKAKIAMALALAIFSGAGYAVICEALGWVCDGNECVLYYRCGRG